MPFSGSRARIKARVCGTKNNTRKFVVQSDDYVFKRDQKLTFCFSSQVRNSVWHYVIALKFSLGRIKRLELELQDTGNPLPEKPAWDKYGVVRFVTEWCLWIGRYIFQVGNDNTLRLNHISNGLRKFIFEN